MSKHRRPGDRRPGLALAALALAGVTLLGASAPAMAAKGGGKGGKPSSGSYSVVVDQPGPYVFGQQITVSTNTPMYPNGAGPYIWLQCYQDGVVVLASDHAGFPEGWYYEKPFTLGPTQMWSGGDANCTVTVVHRSNNRVITDASTSFSVDG